MKNLTLENIIVAVRGDFYGNKSHLRREISFVTTDSRKTDKDCLFAAIKGNNSDGHNYIDTAFKNGALCVIAEHRPDKICGSVIVVKNTIEALGDLAKFYRCQLGTQIIGITGSVGKTTAKEMISSVLSQHYNVHKTPKNLNNDLGVPLTLFGLDESHEVGVIEMGISHFGEMKRLGEIVQPDMALYTTIGCAHLEFLKDFDGVLKAKTEMLPSLPENGTVFVNGDDITLRKLKCSQNIINYGTSNGCNITAENVQINGTDGMNLTVVAGDRRIPVQIKSFGIHLVTAALGAAAVGIKMGLTDEEIAQGISSYEPVGSRSKIIETGKITIIDDCYNANPTSVMAGIDSLSMLSKRRVCILGDMLELGEDSEKLHYDTGVYAAKNGISLLITNGKLSEKTSKGALDGGCENAIHFDVKQKMIAELPKLLNEGDAVLVKASRGMHFEEIVNSLNSIESNIM